MKKQNFIKKHYRSDNDIISTADASQQDENFSIHAIQTLQHQWKKCAIRKGEYVKNKLHLDTFPERILVIRWTSQSNHVSYDVLKQITTECVAVFLYLCEKFQINSVTFTMSISLNFNSIQLVAVIFFSYEYVCIYMCVYVCISMCVCGERCLIAGIK